MPSTRTLLNASILALIALVATASVRAESCLWKVTSGNGTLYLQGSVHLLKAEDYPLAPAIEKAYTKSSSLVFETDLATMMKPEMQQLLMSKALLPDGQTLKDSLAPETYTMLSNRFTQAGLPIEGFQTFKPWFAAMTLTMMKLQAMGFSPAHGLDQHFYNRAVQDGKTVTGLETVEFQINLFDSLAGGNQDAFMERALKDLEIVETMMDEITAAWETGDIEKLGRFMHESFEDFPELESAFLLKRNRQWADRLASMLQKDGTCMVVVGAAHIPGKEGLLELLQAKGCTLEQL